MAKMDFSAREIPFSESALFWIPSTEMLLERNTVTSSSVFLSNCLYPFTASTRFGMRSARRLSWTSIPLHDSFMRFLYLTRRLYVKTDHITSPTTSNNPAKLNILAPLDDQRSLCRSE